jgi:hypothetical protein
MEQRRDGKGNETKHKHRQMGSRDDRNGNRSSTNNRSMDAAKRGAIDHESGRKKRGLHQHFPTDTSKSSLLHQAYWKECAAQKEHTPEMEHIDT